MEYRSVGLEKLISAAVLGIYVLIRSSVIDLTNGIEPVNEIKLGEIVGKRYLAVLILNHLKAARIKESVCGNVIGYTQAVHLLIVLKPLVGANVSERELIHGLKSPIVISYNVIDTSSVCELCNIVAFIQRGVNEHTLNVSDKRCGYISRQRIYLSADHRG